jgi:hypothetical protein
MMKKGRAVEPGIEWFREAMRNSVPVAMAWNLLAISLSGRLCKENGISLLVVDYSQPAGSVHWKRQSGLRSTGLVSI